MKTNETKKTAKITYRGRSMNGKPFFHTSTVPESILSHELHSLELDSSIEILNVEVIS